jgi:hypothetical protein
MTMADRIQLLLQCTIPYTEDDWHVGRFSLLAKQLESVADVVARNREPAVDGNDPILSTLGESRFDVVWLLGVDGGEGLSPRDCAGVNAFQKRGGGLLTVRDHANMGMWLRHIDAVGQAHFFHEKEFGEPDPDRQCADDKDTPSISWPNYHSGNNGDYQRIEIVDLSHPLFERADSPSGHIERFPAHPHEGAVGTPTNEPRARTLARGRSLSTGRTFDLVVAFERAPKAPGRAIAESSFHHFSDYNWQPSRGAPSFVSEKLGDGWRRDPHGLDDVRAYVVNAARWLAPSRDRSTSEPRSRRPASAGGPDAANACSTTR